MASHPAPQVAADETVSHLYVHVPFCPTICPFCSFHVLERRAGTVAAYLDRLDDELARLADRCSVKPRTVYLGGGTPSHLRGAELERLVSIVERRVGWASVEATLEVHPSTASEERARHWVELGFTRLSVGAQSFDDDVLATLQRSHDAATGLRTVDWCLAAGATTGVDVMTAVPNQDVAADLTVAAGLGVHHVSAYTLTIEPDTPFERSGVAVDDHAEAAALRLAGDVLGAAGLERYEVSNYALPGARCHHNVGYWTHEWFVGVGPSASSFLPLTGGGAVRCANPPTDEWLELDGLVMDVPDHLTDPMIGDELLGDAVLCGLRMVDGVDLAAAGDRCGVDAESQLGSRIDALVGEGLLVRDGAVVKATDRGMLVLDRVAAELL